MTGRSGILVPRPAPCDHRGETETLADAVGVLRKTAAEPAVAFLLVPFNLQTMLANREPQQEILDKPLQALRRPRVDNPFRVWGDHQTFIESNLELAAVAGVPLAMTEATRGGPPEGEMRLQQTPVKELFVEPIPGSVELGEGVTIRRLRMPAGEFGVGMAFICV
jgi:hypothetical protein